tara:strand:- start:170 stop:1138 length:969 start_codon:yes stop_codon:yes gene_type:complete
MDISFFIVRCITNELNAFYWKISYDRIRDLYPNANVFIIDDNSRIQIYKIPNNYNGFYNSTRYSKYTKYQLEQYGRNYPDLAIFKGDAVKLYNHWEKHGKYEKRIMPKKIEESKSVDSGYHSIWEELPNLTYIKSEFPGRGELLGYYYFYKIKPTRNAIIIHDSVFINQRIPYNQYNKCEFLWHFNWNVCLDIGSRNDNIHSRDITNILTKFNNNHLIQFFKRKQWHGCFGVMSVINWDLLNTLNTKYDLFRVILSNITNRYKRQCFERIFGILICFELKQVNVLYGNIKNYCKWGTSFHVYMLNKNNLRHRLPITKVWSGR